MNNNRGMALVVALMTSFILLALVASLFWVISATSRQAEYAKNSAIALNLAEAGTADAIYRLNYETELNIGNYPFDGTANPFGTSNLVTLTELPELPPVSGTAQYAPQGIKGNLNNGYYSVGLIDTDPSDYTKTDTIVAVGIFNGVRRILAVPLRGNNLIDTPRQDPATSPQGISEAFNKHVIYANTVTYTAGTVNGNIVYTNACDTPASGTWTKTLVPLALFHVPTPGEPPDLPSDPGGGNFFQNGMLDPPASDLLLPAPNDTSILYGGGTVNWTAATDTYTFTNVTTTDRVEIKSGTTTAPAQEGNVVFSTGNTVSNYFTTKTAATGDININNDITLTGASTVLAPEGAIPISNTGITITGNLIVKGASLLTLDNVRVTGTVISDRDITFSGTIPSVINENAASDTAAVLVKASGDATITINCSPTITLGLNQSAAVYCYSTGGTAEVNVNADLVPTYNNSSQAAVVAYSTTGSTTINIGASGTPQLNGLIYAGSGGATQTAIITLTDGDITGALVAGGTAAVDPATGIVNLTGGTLSYDQPVFTGASLGSDIFSGFSGGRRVYVPVWQGWRLK